MESAKCTTVVGVAVIQCSLHDFSPRIHSLSYHALIAPITIHRMIPKTVKTIPQVLSDSLLRVSKQIPKIGIATIAISTMARAELAPSEWFLLFRLISKSFPNQSLNITKTVKSAAKGGHAANMHSNSKYIHPGA